MEQKPKTVPIRNLRSEEGAEEMVRSENMRPYLGVAEAMLKGQGLKEGITAVSELHSNSGISGGCSRRSSGDLRISIV